MARVCALTGKKVQYGHNVSHSKRATNRRFEPNIQKVRLQSEALGQRVSRSTSRRVRSAPSRRRAASTPTSSGPTT